MLDMEHCRYSKAENSAFCRRVRAVAPLLESQRQEQRGKLRGSQRVSLRQLRPPALLVHQQAVRIADVHRRHGNPRQRQEAHWRPQGAASGDWPSLGQRQRGQPPLRRHPRLGRGQGQDVRGSVPRQNLQRRPQQMGHKPRDVVHEHVRGLHLQHAPREMGHRQSQDHGGDVLQEPPV